ncbi:hypothetical protein FSST1_000678 [Fusarium sambucinum]
MSLSVFHPFARLPVELRLQIWGVACLVSTPSDRRLQYVDVQDGEVVSSPCNWHQYREQIPPQSKNRSSYLIDGGLWKACKESREVIAQHSHFYDWVRIQKQAIVDNDSFSKCPADWPGGHESAHPAIIDTCQDEDECRMLVYPARDIFCIQVEDWVALQQPHYDPEIRMSFIRYNNDYHHELIPNNITLEFGRSWLTDVPDWIYDLRMENSARGYLSYLLDKNDSVRIDVEGLWIIDKEAKWFTNLSKHHATMYRDCDAEYIEVDWADVVNYTGDESPATASKFIQKLDRLFISSSYPSDADFDHSLGRGGPVPQDVLRLLVRRDNEVKDPTMSHDFSQDAFGWVVYIDEYEDDE